MERFLTNCSQNSNTTASSRNDRSVFVSNKEKSNISASRNNSAFHTINNELVHKTVNEVSECSPLLLSQPCNSFSLHAGSLYSSRESQNVSQKYQSQAQNITRHSSNESLLTNNNRIMANASINKTGDRTFQTNMSTRLGGFEQTYVAPEDPNRGHLLDIGMEQSVFKVPMTVPPRRPTSIYSTTGSTVSSQIRRDELNIDGLELIWREVFEMMSRTMPLEDIKDIIRNCKDQCYNKLQKSHSFFKESSTSVSSKASGIREWLSSDPVNERGILTSQTRTERNSGEASVSSSQVDDIQSSSIVPGHLSTIDEDDIDLIFNNSSRARLRDKTLFGQSADTTTEKTDDHSTSRKPETVKSLESNESLQSKKGVTKKVPVDEPKSKNKTVVRNCNKLQQTSKIEEKTGRSQKQKCSAVSETLNTGERAISSRGRRIMPCLKYWEGEKLPQTFVRTDPDISLSKNLKSKERKDTTKLNDSMILRSNKQLNGINRKPGSDESNINVKGVKERTSKLKKNKQEYSSMVGAEEECSEVSKRCKVKSTKNENISSENVPQARNYENKPERKMTDYEEKENKNLGNIKAAKKVQRIPQKQKSNETVKTTRKRKVNTSAEIPNKKKKTGSEQRKTEKHLQEDIFNDSVALFGYSTRSRLSNSFSQATPGTALNSIRKKAPGAGPLGKETPPSKHLASVLNNTEADLEQSKKSARGSADNVNKKNHVNQRVASKMNKGANDVTRVKARKEKQEVKSISNFDDKTNAVLNDVIHGHKDGQKTPKTVEVIFRTHLKESHKNKLSENSDSDSSFTDSDNDDLY